MQDQPKIFVHPIQKTTNQESTQENASKAIPSSLPHLNGLPRPLTTGTIRSSTSHRGSHVVQTSPTPPAPAVKKTPGDELARVFNTVLVSTQSKGKRDFSGELCEVSESAPFKAILSAVRQLSRIHGMTERQASEQIIQTFRKMDQIWGEYVFREGLEKIKSSK